MLLGILAVHLLLPASSRRFGTLWDRLTGNRMNCTLLGSEAVPGCALCSMRLRELPPLGQTPSDEGLSGRPELLMHCDLCDDGRKPAEVPIFNDAGVVQEVRTVCTHVAQRKVVAAIRHAESEWNHVMDRYKKTPIITGPFLDRWMDSPLSKFGLRQAQRLAVAIQGEGRDAKAVEKFVDGALDELKTVPGGLDHAVRIHPCHNLTCPKNVSMPIALGSSQGHDDEALKALSSEFCEGTAIVSSNLQRAIDTILIVMLPKLIGCPHLQWQISSNLQETEYNIDCAPRLAKCTWETQEELALCDRPSVTWRQVMKYKRNEMDNTLEYIKAMYKRADVSRNHNILSTVDRGRYNHEHYSMMRDELAWMFDESTARRFVWSGHSIWFRRFFQFFGDMNDATCMSFSKNKLQNTAVIAFDAYKGRIDKRKTSEPDAIVFVVKNCRVLYLGLDEDSAFTRLKTWKSSAWFVPSWKDFSLRITEYSTDKGRYKCCCSLPYSREVESQSIDSLMRRHLGTCKVALVSSCGDLDHGSMWSSTRTSYHSYEKTYAEECLNPRSCMPGYQCDSAPSAEDFATDITEVVTSNGDSWKCCCSLPSKYDFEKYGVAKMRPKYLGVCQVAKVSSCGNLNRNSWFTTQTAWHSFPKTYKGACLESTVCVQGFRCDGKIAFEEGELHGSHWTHITA